MDGPRDDTPVVVVVERLAENALVVMVTVGDAVVVWDRSEVDGGVPMGSLEMEVEVKNFYCIGSWERSISRTKSRAQARSGSGSGRWEFQVAWHSFCWSKSRWFSRSVSRSRPRSRYPAWWR